MTSPNIARSIPVLIQHRLRKEMDHQMNIANEKLATKLCVPGTDIAA